MNGRPSKYGTVVAAITVGVAYGVIMERTTTLIFLLALAAFFIALRFVPDASAALLVITIGVGVCAGVLAFFALFSEITGEAAEYYMQGRRFKGEPVSRSDTPFRFRRANNIKWGFSLLSAAAATATFTYRRKLNDSDFPP